jgi:hypothetical protein
MLGRAVITTEPPQLQHSTAAPGGVRPATSQLAHSHAVRTTNSIEPSSSDFASTTLHRFLDQHWFDARNGQPVQDEAR